jgi:hypothetical protein
MSLSTGKSKLGGSLKDLMLRWEKTKMLWDDPMSRELEQNVLEMLDPKVRAAITAMDKMGDLLAKARRDCG